VLEHWRHFSIEKAAALRWEVWVGILVGAIFFVLTYLQHIEYWSHAFGLCLLSMTIARYMVRLLISITLKNQRGDGCPTLHF
jgi:hypothetical protein